MLSIVCSITTHFYSKISTTKINKWAWGTFDISICVQLISHTHTGYKQQWERTQYVSVITVHVCNPRTYIEKQIAYRIKRLVWLDLLKAERCPKRYWQRPRSQLTARVVCSWSAFFVLYRGEPFVVDVFMTTPKMSTYLLAVCVTDFLEFASNISHGILVSCDVCLISTTTTTTIIIIVIINTIIIVIVSSAPSPPPPPPPTPPP